MNARQIVFGPENKVYRYTGLATNRAAWNGTAAGHANLSEVTGISSLSMSDSRSTVDATTRDDGYNRTTVAVLADRTLSFSMPFDASNTNQAAMLVKYRGGGTNNVETLFVGNGATNVVGTSGLFADFCYTTATVTQEQDGINTVNFEARPCPGTIAASWVSITA
jgi:hypothetical protein